MQFCPGDHVKVSRGAFTHHGIVVHTDGTIIDLVKFDDARSCSWSPEMMSAASIPASAVGVSAAPSLILAAKLAPLEVLHTLSKIKFAELGVAACRDIGVLRTSGGIIGKRLGAKTGRYFGGISGAASGERVGERLGAQAGAEYAPKIGGWSGEHVGRRVGAGLVQSAAQPAAFGASLTTSTAVSGQFAPFVSLLIMTVGATHAEKIVSELGAKVGRAVGESLGRLYGEKYGRLIGNRVGHFFGLLLGQQVGKTLGASAGKRVGVEIGTSSEATIDGVSEVDVCNALEDPNLPAEVFTNMAEAWKRHGATGYIRLTSLNTFKLSGQMTLVQRPPDLSSGIAAVERAWSKLFSPVEYNVMCRNCEHFASWCIDREGKSAQVSITVAGTNALGGIVVATPVATTVATGTAVTTVGGAMATGMGTVGAVGAAGAAGVFGAAGAAGVFGTAGAGIAAGGMGATGVLSAAGLSGVFGIGAASVGVPAVVVVSTFDPFLCFLVILMFFVAALLFGIHAAAKLNAKSVDGDFPTMNILFEEQGTN